MENKSKFLQSSHQRKRVKRQIVFSKKNDVKTIPKLLTWETKYQHTMFDFLKKDKINKENENKIAKSNILCENLNLSFKSDIAKPKIESSQVVLKKERRESFISEVDFFIPEKSDDAVNVLSLKPCQSKDFGCSDCRFRLIDNENLNLLYDVPFEFKSKFVEDLIPKFVKSFSNPFETGSLNYNIKDLDKLYCLPEKN